jgi:hypothetical protein
MRSVRRVDIEQSREAARRGGGAGGRRGAAAPGAALARAVGNRAFARALLQRAVQYPGVAPPAIQNTDPLAEIVEGRLEFGFTAPIVNGQEIRRNTDLDVALNLPVVETRDGRPMPAVRPGEGEVMLMGWESRLVPPVPVNALSYQIYIPTFTRWRRTLTKVEINKVFERLHLADRFVDEEGNAELEMIPHPNMGAFYRHVFEHEASHAEDHIYVLGAHLEDWDRAVERVASQGWGFLSRSEQGTEYQLWKAVGKKPDQLLAEIWHELDEAGHAFHLSAEGRAPRFPAGTVHEQQGRATLTVTAPPPPGG